MSYEAELQEWLESHARPLYFPSRPSGGGRDGLIVKVTPAGREPWIGMFAFGDVVSDGLSGLYRIADGSTLIVVSNGAGYVVTADSPARWHQLPVQPVIEAHTLLESRMNVFADFTRVCAYGPPGHMWTTRDISWDGLHIDRCDGRQLFVVAWDAPNQRHMTATIALSTGQVTGGPSTPPP